MKFITINWEKLNIMEIYLHIDSNFFDRFIKTTKEAMSIFSPYSPTYNPEIMRNFPYKKFCSYQNSSWYISFPLG